MTKSKNQLDYSNLESQILFQEFTILLADMTKQLELKETHIKKLKKEIKKNSRIRNMIKLIIKKSIKSVKKKIKKFYNFITKKSK